MMLPHSSYAVYQFLEGRMPPNTLGVIVGGGILFTQDVLAAADHIIAATYPDVSALIVLYAHPDFEADKVYILANGNTPPQRVAEAQEAVERILRAVAVRCVPPPRVEWIN